MPIVQKPGPIVGKTKAFPSGYAYKREIYHLGRKNRRAWRMKRKMAAVRKALSEFPKAEHAADMRKELKTLEAALKEERLK